MGHTTQAGVDLLGFGASSISELRGSYAQSERDVKTWQESVLADGVATMRGHLLSQDDIERRWIISCIICLGELRAEEYREEFRKSVRRTLFDRTSRVGAGDQGWLDPKSIRMEVCA